MTEKQRTFTAALPADLYAAIELLQEGDEAFGATLVRLLLAHPMVADAMKKGGAACIDGASGVNFGEAQMGDVTMGDIVGGNIDKSTHYHGQVPAFAVDVVQTRILYAMYGPMGMVRERHASNKILAEQMHFTHQDMFDEFETLLKRGYVKDKGRGDNSLGSPGFPGVKHLFADRHGFLMRKNEISLTRMRVKTVYYSGKSWRATLYWCKSRLKGVKRWSGGERPTTLRMS